MNQTQEDTQSFLWVSGNMGITRVDLQTYDIERYENFWSDIEKTEPVKAISCLYSPKNEVILGIVEDSEGEYFLRVLSVELVNHKKETKNLEMKSLYNQGKT